MDIKNSVASHDADGPPLPTEVAVVGARFAALGIAMHVKRSGYTSFVVL